MNIEIKKSKKPVNYEKAIKYLEDRVELVYRGEAKELIWILEHPSIFTGGSGFKKNEIIDKSIKVHKVNRGGKITWHGPGQLVCYLIINLNNRNRDIRKFINAIENSIIETLNNYKIKSFCDRKNIGIWIKTDKGKFNKIAAIGIKVKKWITYHGFSININNDLSQFKKIIPCGIKDKGISKLKNIKDINYKFFKKKLINILIKNLQI